jgi:hypothetical protein
MSGSVEPALADGPAAVGRLLPKPRSRHARSTADDVRLDAPSGHKGLAIDYLQELYGKAEALYLEALETQKRTLGADFDAIIERVRQNAAAHQAI